MRIQGRKLSALVAVATLAVAGCGGSTEDSAQTSASPSASSSATQESTPDDSKSEQTQDHDGSAAKAEDNAVEIEIEIEHGQVTPSGERVDVQLGQPIRLVVDSDAPDEIHVHSTPEQELEYQAGESTVTIEGIDQPGTVDVESHSLEKVIVQLEVK